MLNKVERGSRIDQSLFRIQYAPSSARQQPVAGVDASSLASRSRGVRAVSDEAIGCRRFPPAEICRSRYVSRRRTFPVKLTVSTWNINSVRLRIEQVGRFLQERRPDVLCLQETKCPNDKFPAEGAAILRLSLRRPYGPEGL